MNIKSLGMALCITYIAPIVHAVNNAPADVSVVNLRTSCTENSGNVEIPNCFDSMNELANWLKTVRQSSQSNPTLVEIGPGSFGSWHCKNSHVTMRGSGRDRTIITNISGGFAFQALSIDAGCTNLNVQDLTIDGKSLPWGVSVFNLEAVTSWTNVEVFGGMYGWIESIPSSCLNHNGKHSWFSSRITSLGLDSGNVSRAYTATCAESWFWGSELTSHVNRNETNGFALEAHSAEVHLYGSTVRLLLESNTTANHFTLLGAGGSGHYLLAGLNGSNIHIHGTGLDVIHKGTGTADMLYADSNSHFHANESGFNIHVSGAGKVQRVAGSGNIETPYSWGADSRPPLSTASSGVQTLLSRNGTDTYIETDCPISDHCSAGGNYPHLMIYRAECIGVGTDEGPWFDTVTSSCRQ